MTSNAVAVRPNGKSPAQLKVGENLTFLDQYLQSKKDALAKVVGSVATADRMARVVMNCVTRTPALRDCTAVSIFRCVMQAAELGLEPGGTLGEAYLVPFAGNCTLIPSYRGLVTLARRSGEVLKVRARLVYEGDEFRVSYGLHESIEHIPAFQTNDPAKITHVYAVADLEGGGEQFDVMTRAEIEAIRKQSKTSGRGPWVEHYGEMARKTVVRRLVKMLPMSVALIKAVTLSDAADTGDFTGLEFDTPDALPEPIDVTPERGNEALAARLGDVPAETVQTPADATVPPPTWEDLAAHPDFRPAADDEAGVGEMMTDLLGVKCKPQPLSKFQPAQIAKAMEVLRARQSKSEALFENE